MKKIFGLLMMAALVMGCSDDFDDSEIYDRLEDLTSEQEQMEETIETLQAAITELDSRLDTYDKVTSIEPLTDEDGTQTGYTIYFLNSDPVVITYGEDGEDGQDGEDGSSGSSGSTGAAGSNGAVVSVEYTEGDTEVTITITDSTGSKSEYTFFVSTPAVEIAFDATSYVLKDGDNTITFTVTGDVAAIYATVVDDTNGIGTATTKLGSPTSEWSVEISGSEGDYTVTLDLVTPMRDVTNGVLTITAEDTAGEQVSGSVTFSYGEADAVEIMFSIAELEGGFVDPSGHTTWTVTDMIMDADDFGVLNDELQGLTEGSITLNFPYLLTDVPSATNTTGMFYDCNALLAVSMPKVEVIGDYAFYKCTKLTTVDITAAETIGYESFSGCNALMKISENNELAYVTSIDYQGFYHCENLESISLPMVTEIGYAAFHNCKKIVTVDMPNVESIGSFAFKECSMLKTVNSDVDNLNKLEKLTYVGDYEIFCVCVSLETISMPAITTLEQEIFYGCTSLKSVEAVNATTIDYRAFYDCTALVTVNLPKVTTMGDSVFLNAFDSTIASTLYLASDSSLESAGNTIFSTTDSRTANTTLYINSASDIVTVAGTKVTINGSDYTFSSIVDSSTI